MRFGMCTDIATATRDRVEYALLERIKEAGFDYVEFPLMMIDTLSDEDFEYLLSELKRLDLACDCSCNYFPGRIKVTGPTRDRKEIDAYLDQGESLEQGYDELCQTIHESVVPYCQKYGIHVVMEPIRKQSGNILITVKDGWYVVNRVHRPEVVLLADLMHMMYNEENAEDLREIYPLLHHVHVCEMDRLIPEDGFSPFLTKALGILKELGYDETISFESKGGKGPDSMKKALAQIKEFFK